MRALLNFAGSGLIALATYTGIHAQALQGSLNRHRNRDYAATIAALEAADNALEYVPDQDRDIDVSGLRIPFGVREKLPDLDRARASLDTAITSAPASEQSKLRTLANLFSTPGLHQSERKYLRTTRNEYILAQSENADKIARLKHRARTNTNATLIFAGAATCLFLAGLLTKK